MKTMRHAVLVCLLIIKGSLLGHEPESPIFLDTLPKSGTAYMTTTLSRFFHLEAHQYAKVVVPGISIAPPGFEKASQNKRFLIFTHDTPGENHHHQLKSYYDHYLLHVRDPRQALVSWIHYVDCIHKQDPHLVRPMPDVPPEEYFKMSFHEKVDWQIHHFFAWTLLWIDAWLDIIEGDPKIPIKVTTFEDMVTDPLSFFRGIVAFYGIDPESFTENDLPRKKDVFHFRIGRTDEWRDVLTQKQQDQITSMMPQRLFDAFGWTP